MDYSQLEFADLSAKDQKIIKDNPGATIAQLREYGISEKSVKTLESIQIVPFEPKNNILHPTRVEQAQPKVRFKGSFGGSATGSNTLTTVYNERTGLEVTMRSDKAARLTGKMNPDRVMSKVNRGRNYSTN